MIVAFRSLHPSEIAGFVLLDPGDGRLKEMLRSHMTTTHWAARHKAMGEAMPKMPPAIKAELDADQKSGKYADEAFPLPEVPMPTGQEEP